MTPVTLVPERGGGRANFIVIPAGDWRFAAHGGAHGTSWIFFPDNSLQPEGFEPFS